MGPEMMQQFRDQAERFGTRMITDDVVSVELSKEPGGVHVVHGGGDQVLARSVILAMGAEPKKLGVPGEEDLSARGVSYCATCDAAFYRDKPTIVVGGGDTAMEDATFLAKFAKDVKVVHRRDEFRASAVMLNRAKATDNIELLTPYTVASFEPGDDGALANAVLAHTDGGDERTLEIDGAFIAIGHRPNSDIVKDQVETDENGYVIVDSPSTRTNLPGVFAAGDLVDHTYRQAVTAAGSGCAAALDAEAYLRDSAPDPEKHWTPGAVESSTS
jgi:thioredoxin reductase (NADPH)